VSAPLRVVIADDERPARLFLAAALKGFDDVRIVGEAADGMEAVRTIERENPDLAFLDLQMPELDGIGVVRMLKRNRMPLIAFVTAYDRYAVRAFELNAVDYLLKPVEPARLREALDRAQDRLERAEHRALRSESAGRIDAAVAEYEHTAPLARLERIPVRRRGEIVFVQVRDLVSIVAEGELLHLRTRQNEKHTISHRLRDIEARVDANRFLRLGRGVLVNLDAIRRIVPLPGGAYTVVLQNHEEFRVSRIQSRIVRDRLLRL
jgi:two-component system LytT family response regulator